MVDPPYKRARYAPNLLPATISVASENSVSTLTNPSDLPDILPTDGPKTLHILKKGLPVKVCVHRGYCCRKHGSNKMLQKDKVIAPHAQTKTRNFIVVIVFPGLVWRQGLASWNNNILCH